MVIILVDEAEKADPAVHQAFLSILDTGNLDLANNTSADFRNAIIFFTSNIGNQQVEQLREIAQKEAAAQDIPEAFREAAGEALTGGEAKETVNEAFKMAFPPEFRGRIKDLIIFRNLSEDAISKIIDLKMNDLEREFTHNGVPILIELDETAKAWLTKNGYNPSEGARALEKLIQAAIRDQLTLAHGSLGLANKTIYIEQDEQTKELAFYFSENPDLPQPKPQQPQSAQAQTTATAQANQQDTIQKPETSLKKPILIVTEVSQPPQKPAIPKQPEVPQIPPTVKEQLIQQYKRSLNYYLATRNEFVKNGLLGSMEDANLQPEIVTLAANQLRIQFSRGLDYYLKYRDSLARAGIFNIPNMNNWSVIKKEAEAQLAIQLRRGHIYFIDYRDKLVQAGIGTLEEWNKLL